MTSWGLWLYCCCVQGADFSPNAEIIRDDQPNVGKYIPVPWMDFFWGMIEDDISYPVMFPGILLFQAHLVRIFLEVQDY